MIEDLFILEAELRSAAVNYAEWSKAPTPTDFTKAIEHRGAVNGARKRLRTAARAYAHLANSIEDRKASGKKS